MRVRLRSVVALIERGILRVECDVRIALGARRIGTTALSPRLSLTASVERRDRPATSHPACDTAGAPRRRRRCAGRGECVRPGANRVDLRASLRHSIHADWTSSGRKAGGPAFVRCHFRCRSTELASRGTRPTKAVTRCASPAHRAGGSRTARHVSATTGPTPGAVINGRTIGSACARARAAASRSRSVTVWPRPVPPCRACGLHAACPLPVHPGKDQSAASSHLGLARSAGPHTVRLEVTTARQRHPTPRTHPCGEPGPRGGRRVGEATPVC